MEGSDDDELGSVPCSGRGTLVGRLGWVGSRLTRFEVEWSGGVAARGETILAVLAVF